MSTRKYRKLAVLAKKETVYKSDAEPTGAANAILMTDVTVMPLAGAEVSRDLLLPYFGQQGVILTNNHATLTGSVEIAGAGAAGTLPAYGVLLQACGLAPVVTAGQQVVYSPVSDAGDAVTLHYNRDGVRHVFVGARGTMTMNLVPSQIPRMQFTLTGLLGTISDLDLPQADVTKFVKPVEVSMANTSLAYNGATMVAESTSIDLGNQIEPRFLIGDEKIEHVERQSSGSMVVEARKLAIVDWFDRSRKRTRAAMKLTQGTVAGNIFEINAPAVEIGRPTEGETQRIMNYTIPLMLCPILGNDELTITVK